MFNLLVKKNYFNSHCFVSNVPSKEIGTEMNLENEASTQKFSGFLRTWHIAKLGSYKTVQGILFSLYLWEYYIMEMNI